MRRKKIIMVLVLVCILCFDVSAQDPEEAGKIEWPSREYPTIQSAVDAMEDGWELRIAAGVFDVDEPVMVVRKKIVIKGAGSGRNPNKETTHLMGRPPRPVVDDQGNLILPAEDVVGMFHFVGSDVVVENIKMTGFDAAMVCLPDQRNCFGSTTVRYATIADTGRGILSLTPGRLTVGECTFAQCSWNGISVAPKIRQYFGLSVNLFTYESIFINPGGAGIYLSDALASIHGESISNAVTGGIVASKSKVFITDCQITHNRQAGIIMGKSNQFPFLLPNYIQGNVISYTQADFNGNFGDGIALLLSDATIINNTIDHCDRAGIANFGSDLAVGNNHVNCTSFDMDGEVYDNTNFNFNDLDGNYCCQCGGSPGPCQIATSLVTPPPPVGGLE